jgi:hypothetical protein
MDLNFVQGCVYIIGAPRICGASVLRGRHFCVKKDISEKYIQKYAFGLFLLSFLKGMSDQCNSFTKMLNFVLLFQETPMLATLNAI